MNIPTEYFRECFEYDPATGKVFWRERPEHHFRKLQRARVFNTKFAGKQVGTLDKNGYIQIGLTYNGQQTNFYAHRVIWLLVHGCWPSEIDHINGDRADNRLANLRGVTRSENARNACRRNDNSSGVTGVDWDRGRGKWQSRIFHQGKNKHIGYFDDFEEAVIARKSAERKYDYHKNHGRIVEESYR